MLLFEVQTLHHLREVATVPLNEDEFFSSLFAVRKKLGLYFLVFKNGGRKIDGQHMHKIKIVYKIRA